MQVPEDQFGSEALWRWKHGLAAAEFDGEQVVWDPETGQIVRLDRIGSLVCSALSAGFVVAGLVDDLATAFDAPSDRVRSDVENLLRRLFEIGLVVREPGNPRTL